MNNLLSAYLQDHPNIVHDMINRISVDNYFLIKPTYILRKPILRRETTDQNYMQQLLVGDKSELDKIWFKSRIDRAMNRQKSIQETGNIRYNGCGYLLYDIVNSEKSINEILLFRISNAQNRHLKNAYIQLYSMNILPESCIREILSYLNYKETLYKYVNQY